MLSLHGSMRLLVALLVLTYTEAKRRRPSSLEKDQENIFQRSKTNDVDVYPKSFGASVDFGHVYRDSRKMQNFDKELDMMDPTSLEQARQLLRKIGSDVAWKKKDEEPLGFANPRDAIRYHGGRTKSNANRNIGEKTMQPGGTAQISKIIEDEIKKGHSGHKKIPEGKLHDEKENRKERFFSRSSFELLLEDKVQYSGNWTTCKEFAKGAVFHPDDVIHLEWVPFYIWSLRRFSNAVVHTLTYPTKKLVKEYKEKFDQYLNIKMDWEQPKLLLKELNDMLLIAGDRKGLFYGIPYVKLPSSVKYLNITLPVMIIRMKIVNPYLAMMYCDEHYAVIMSVVGTEPESDAEKTAESAILKFQGIGEPASRDLKEEARKAKFDREMERREQERMYINIKKPTDTLDASLW